MIWVLIVIGVAAIVAVWSVVLRKPHHEPGVASFRRHIDALSTEARREVMDRVRPPYGNDHQNDQHGDDPQSGTGI
jgi:hypothetical protein